MERGLQGFAIKHTAYMVILDILALFFYVTHIPEKWWPHTFDLWVSESSYSLIISYCKLTVALEGLQGASHQIFHILIGIGQVTFLLGLREVMLSHYLHAEGPVPFQLPNHTSLSM